MNVSTAQCLAPLYPVQPSQPFLWASSLSQRTPVPYRLWAPQAYGHPASFPLGRVPTHKSGLITPNPPVLL